jgi:hypothetical protein
LALTIASVTFFWLPSSIEMFCESCFSLCPVLRIIIFEGTSRLSRLQKKAFYENEMTWIRLPDSLEVICESCYSSYGLLKSVTVQATSKLSCLEKSAFHRSGRKSIIIPGSVEVNYELCFFLLRVTFVCESGGKFEMIPLGRLGVFFQWNPIDSSSKFSSRDL